MTHYNWGLDVPLSMIWTVCSDIPILKQQH